MKKIKKQEAKLALHRETLRSLQEDQLGQALGGIVGINSSVGTNNCTDEKGCVMW